MVSEVAPSIKRYNLALPEEVFNQVQALADKDHTTVVEIIRKFIRLGLLVTRAQESGEGVLIIRQGDVEQRVIIL